MSAVALATFGERLWIAATGSPGIDRTATLPAEAMHALRTDYAAAPAHKAFVASAGGTWGWSGAAPSVEVAIAGATAHCEAERKRDAPPCELLNVNGEAMGR